MGSKPPQTRKGTQGFPFQTLPRRSETTGRKAAQVRLKIWKNRDLQNHKFRYMRRGELEDV